jgi:hypothetical protein
MAAKKPGLIKRGVAAVKKFFGFGKKGGGAGAKGARGGKGGRAGGGGI